MFEKLLKLYMANGDSLEKIDFELTQVNKDPSKVERQNKLKEEKAALEKELKHQNMQIHRVRQEAHNKIADRQKDVNKISREINEKKAEFELSHKKVQQQDELIELIKSFSTEEKINEIMKSPKPKARNDKNIDEQKEGIKIDNQDLKEDLKEECSPTRRIDHQRGVTKEENDLDQLKLEQDNSPHKEVASKKDILGELDRIIMNSPTKGKKDLDKFAEAHAND